LAALNQEERDQWGRLIPEAHRRLLRRIAAIGLTGDVVVALALYALAPLEQIVLDMMLVILVMSGVAMAIVFSFILPRIYEENYISLALPGKTDK